VAERWRGWLVRIGGCGHPLRSKIELSVMLACALARCWGPTRYLLCCTSRALKPHQKCTIRQERKTLLQQRSLRSTIQLLRGKQISIRQKKTELTAAPTSVATTITWHWHRRECTFDSNTNNANSKQQHVCSVQQATAAATTSLSSTGKRSSRQHQATTSDRQHADTETQQRRATCSHLRATTTGNKEQWSP